MVNPLGFYDATPCFSWKLPSETEKQTAYRITAWSEEQPLWDSGWVESDQSVSVVYEGKPLTSGQRVYWRVDYQDEKGVAAGATEPAFFELGLLSKKDWKAQWIRPVDPLPQVESVSWLRREFEVPGKVAKARLHVTARGLFEIHANGQKVGRDEFASGWTSYHKRLDSLTYDVTHHIREGKNALGAVLGTGWYAGKMGLGKNPINQYGSQPELLLQLEIETATGERVTLVSDEQWKAAFSGPIRVSSIYDGETYDARAEMPGWSNAEYDDAAWSEVKANPDLGKAKITPKPFAPVRITETLPVKAITEAKKGHFVFDLGQNMVGYPEIHIPVKPGQTITMRFAEMLRQDGTIYTENYRKAKSTNHYTAAKTGAITWRPTFTFHGFRYVELSGFDEEVKPQKTWVRGLVLHSDLTKIGRFDSSHGKLNQLQSNITWGQRGNFLDIPTDCPQRDERLGWTGDAQVFCATSMFNFDSHGFWKSWLGSMRDDQLKNGRIPSVVPDIFRGREGPGWMDAATIIPWNAYVRTGDRDLLDENFEMMAKLVGYYRSKAEEGHIPKISDWGDWLQPHAKETKGDTPSGLLATAFYAHSADLVARAAAALGKESEAREFSAESETVKAAFRRQYLDEDHKITNAPETQTAYVLALEFELTDAAARPALARHLARLIKEAGGHLRTGFLGTPYLIKVLEQYGHRDLAFAVLFNETYPSWFYSINQGATTMWERWDSYSKKDGFHPEGMNSFNHYAYGAIGEWLYQRVAGLAPDPVHPGYKHFFVRPMPGGPLRSASARLETAYGFAMSEWSLDGKTLSMTVSVPPNTTATIEFPNERPSEVVKPGMHEFQIEL